MVNLNINNQWKKKWQLVLGAILLSIIMGYLVSQQQFIVIGSMAIFVISAYLVYLRGREAILWLALMFLWLPFMRNIPYVSKYVGPFENIAEVMVYFLLGLSLISNNQKIQLNLRSIFSKIGIGVLPVGMYFLAGILPAFLNSPMGLEFRYVRMVVLYPIAILLVCLSILQNRSQIKHLLWVFIMSSTILLGLLLFGFLTKTFDTRPDSIGGQRLGASIPFPTGGELVVGENTLAACVSIFIPFVLYVWIKGTNWVQRTVGMLIILLAGGVLLLTQGRTGWIAASTALIIIILGAFITRQKESKATLIKIMAILVVGFIAIQMLVNDPQKSSRYVQRIEMLFSDPLSDSSLLGRVDNWQYYFDRLLLNPLGEGWYATVMSTTADIIYPHNAMLYMGAVSGWLGIVGYLSVQGWIGYNFLRNLTLRNCDAWLMIIGLASVIAWVINGIAVPVAMYDYYASAMVWWPISIALTAGKLSLVSNGTNEVGSS